MDILFCLFAYFSFIFSDKFVLHEKNKLNSENEYINISIHARYVRTFTGGLLGLDFHRSVLKSVLKCTSTHCAGGMTMYFWYFRDREHGGTAWCSCRLGAFWMNTLSYNISAVRCRN